MKSSRNRSRSKGNRNRSVGNVVNRVFDSSGPEGKVRGTPQQIIEKYNQLTRDAQLGNDRVAAENFQQHAEHYLRLLSEAQREQDARREQQNQQNQQNQPKSQNDGGGGGGDGAQAEAKSGNEGDKSPKTDGQPDARGGFDTVIDDKADGKSALVDTPEGSTDAPAKPARSRSPRSRKPSSGPKAQKSSGADSQSSDAAPGGDGSDPSPQEAAE